MAEIKGKVLAKAGTGKSIKVGEAWYAAYKAEELNGIEKGDEVSIEFTKKGIFNNIKKITKVEVPKAEPKKEEPSPEAEFKCSVCGKALKDGKYKTCFTCKNKVSKDEKGKSEYAPNDRSFYGSPEDIAGKQRGNALSSAAAAVAGNMVGAQPGDIAEAIIMLADRFLDWVRAE